MRDFFQMHHLKNSGWGEP